MHIEYGSDIDSKANLSFMSNSTDISWLNNSYLFRSARDCLKYIASSNKSTCQRVLLPILCCNSMYLPFLQHGYEILYYPLNNDYSINTDYVNSIIGNNDIIIIANYFGLKDYSTIKQEDLYLFDIKNKYNSIIIKDYTQSLEDALFIDKSNDDYSIFSSRKWAGFPDGGILWSSKNLSINFDQYDSSYFDMKKKAIDLKSEYLENNSEINLKNEFISLFRQADTLLEEDEHIIEISNYSKELLHTIDFEKILKIRKKHISYYKENLTSLNNLCINTNCSGLYFPIYVDNNIELQAFLASKNIYCPIIWPLPVINQNTSFSFCNSIVNHMLAIPCDQRYNFNELDFIIKNIMAFFN